MLQIYITALVILWVAGLALLIVIPRLQARAISQGQPAANSPRRLAGGTAVLLTATAGLVLLAVRELNHPPAARPNELVIEAAAVQCGWRFDYLQSGAASQELVIPVGRPVRLQITSQEGPETFSVPGLELKGSARPQQWTTLALLPKEIDDYPVTSSESCQGQDEAPVTLVRVVEPMAFQSWLVEQPSGTRPTLVVSQAEKGQQLAETSGCLGCHSVDGSDLAGPTLLGLYGAQRRLEDGSTVLADDNYLITAIRDPGAQVSDGFPNIMPAAFTMLSEDELQAIVAYLASLK